MTKKFLLLALLVANFFYAQNTNPLIDELNKDDQRQWADSIYKNMSLDQKIGQLFMLDIFSSASDKDIKFLKHRIKKYHIGGIIFSKGTAEEQVKLTNEFQKIAETPLLIGMDAEWGLAMRLENSFAFPYNMTLGAIDDNNLVFDVAKQIAQHSKRVGVHFNFAPVVDLNSNPKNPIIGNRAFGEGKQNVTSKSIALIKGFQSEDVLTSAKHFPGHGDTDQDSHKLLPSIDADSTRLMDTEIYPYRKLINYGLTSVMVAHLKVPALTDSETLPTSLSKKVVTDLLQNEMNFKGLIFTDALNMKGASQYGGPGEAELQAFLAGNDILLIPNDLDAAFDKIKKAYNDGIITDKRLSNSVRKILFAKYKVGLKNYQQISQVNLKQDLATDQNKATRFKAFQKAITLVKNDLGLLPIADLQDHKIAYVKLGDAKAEKFYNTLTDYAEVDYFTSESDKLLEKLKTYQTVIIGHHKSDETPWKSYELRSFEIKLIQLIAKQNNLVLANFTSPYALLDLDSFLPIESIIQSYQNAGEAQQVTAEIIFGASEAVGQLPVSVTSAYPEGTGLKTKSLGRLGYDFLENKNFDATKLRNQIDSIANLVLSDKMSPGFQLLIAKDKKILFEKSYGFHTYDKKINVKNDDLYDLASLTKILATLPIFMRLEEEDKVDIEDHIKDILPAYKNSNKGDISLKRMLSHYAKLEAWIPFYINTLETKNDYYRNEKSDEFSIQVADDLYLRSDYQDSIYEKIKQSELRTRDEYKYSDLPFYFLKEYIETSYQDSLQNLVQDLFYKPMGIQNLFYLPRDQAPLNRIVPTENDELWREQLIHGFVHDQGAAMLGGIGGHAGLFGNAKSVAQMMQLYLNDGYYGGKNYFLPRTLHTFNKCYYCDEDVRRGLGFDKPQLDDVGPTCGCLSMTSFGHSGFTGTYAWVDPSTDILYVFLSNRIYPDATNRQLITEDIRTKLQQYIYDALHD
ncbi:MAG: glycoside hydrolase family 3 N-terminal domain-containing protein [Psychroflexus sp.]|uniref:glycoside hydrolase family 3 N-terminal domain-containing protein n=1 Tax=Psychroflexus sp. S27 TaxID=1982757 RepID=UPI000C2AB3A0|nr:glycoside hydrolase family 3 N-terminal domain-containing protein [Psychroflexus sp. S27]PJX20690.1 beta-N-acetylglucosaminidase [Psychroflexus sp. S27]